MIISYLIAVLLFRQPDSFLVHYRGKAGQDTSTLPDNVLIGWYMCGLDHDWRRHHGVILQYILC